MIFNMLLTIFLGIVGGIISSMIVSRVFLILSSYQEKYKTVETLMQHVNYISGFLMAIKTVLQISYDQDREIEKEKEKFGYKTDMEYYAAHKDKDWISKDDLLNNFFNTVQVKSNILSNNLLTVTTDAYNREIMHTINEFVSLVSLMKEFSFSKLNEIEIKSDEISNLYIAYKNSYNKNVLKKIFKDKMIILLIAIIILIIILMIVCSIFGF